ncbi:MAG: hypothetical protein K2X87_20840 [Gemmataceae bacterium]|nr:hypothetical protein [Gemmataceae bacterium]
MGEPYRTWDEIEKLYPNQWVLLDRLKKGRTPDVVFGGHVIYHGSDKAAMLAVINQLPTPFDIASRYTGTFGDDEDVLVWEGSDDAHVRPA